MQHSTRLSSLEDQLEPGHAALLNIRKRQSHSHLSPHFQKKIATADGVAIVLQHNTI